MILDGGDFVDELKQHVELQTKMQNTVTLACLLEVVSGLDPEDVRRPSKTRAPTATRGEKILRADSARLREVMAKIEK
jgi:hypothetical protein